MKNKKLNKSQLKTTKEELNLIRKLKEKSNCYAKIDWETWFKQM